MKKTMMKWGLATSVMVLATTVVPVLDSGNPAVDLFSAQQVEASSIVTYKTKENLKLRAGASTKDKHLFTIPKGKEVSYISKSGSWYKVKYGSMTGYVSSSYLTKVSPKPVVVAPVTPKASTSSVVKYKTKDKLNLRTGASTKHKALLMIPKGKEVQYLSKSGTWFKVKYGTKTGYVSSSYLTKVTAPAPKPVAKPAPKPVVKPVVTPKAPLVKKEYVTTDSLNMRSGGSVGYKVVTTIPKGRTVLYLDKSTTGWYKVSYNGKTGYVSPSYLNFKIPVVYKSTKYNLTLNEMVALQFKLNGQTDAYRYHTSYVRKEFVEKAKPTDKTGTVLVDSPVVSNDTKHTFGTVKAKSKVTIIGETKLFYQISFQPWRNAKTSDITPNVDPKRFAKGTSAYYQFLDLSVSANVTSTEMNKVLKGKGILNNMGKAFVDAGDQHKVNEVYLVSHSMLETGYGTSQLSKGVMVSEVDGKKVPAKKVYNMFGIGAYDESALKSGSERAYKEGWTTPEKAIIGGAKYIGEAYVNNPEFKQNTLYKMRWNPGNPGKHQYATDIGWAVKQTKNIKSLYEQLDEYSLTFDAPVYK